MNAITLRNGKTSIQVNGPLIAAGITRAGLSAREVARRCGLTFAIILRATRNNEYSADLPVRHLAQLADLLDLTITDLLNTEPLPSAQPQLPHGGTDHDDATPAEDVQRLAAALALSDYLGGPDRVAQGLDWTLERLHATSRTLNQHLAPIGLKVTILNDHIYLTTTIREHRGQRERDIKRIEVLETQDRNINITLARLLDDAINDRRPKVHREADKPQLAYAVNVGYLAPDQQNGRDLAASPALRDAFPDL